jgi:hypothetical protein
MGLSIPREATILLLIPNGIRVSRLGPVDHSKALLLPDHLGPERLRGWDALDSKTPRSSRNDSR